MIAIPVKTNTIQSAISPLFGKAKWFALINKAGEITFWENIFQSGREVVNYLQASKVDRVVFQDIGANPYLLLHNAGIVCYHSGHGRIVLNEALQYLENGSLIRVTSENMAEYVERPHRHNKEEHAELHHCDHHGDKHGH